VRWDAHGSELHRARVRGPALVAFAQPVEFRERRRGLVARPRGDSPGPHTVVIGGGQMLEVRGPSKLGLASSLREHRGEVAP
jgi:hypothetical protein